MVAGKSESTATLRAAWLGNRLKELRERKGIKAGDAADAIGKHRNTLTRFESGEYALPPEALENLLNLYGVSSPQERVDLRQLREAVVQRGWAEAHSPYLSTKFADYVWLEDRAHAMHVLDINAVPGLLQTSAYTTALFAQGPQRDNPEEVRLAVETRVLRSRILTRVQAPTFRFLVYEAALLQHVGGREVMAEQLDHLQELAKLPNVELRILPVEAWSHTAATVGGGFTIFELPRPLPDVACVETIVGGIFEESPDLDLISSSYDAVWSDSLPAEDSLARIAHLAKDIR